MCKNLCLIDCLSCIATGSTLYPVQKSYNQTRLGFEFQIERNSYAKQTLITMENTNLSTTTDRQTITVRLTIRAPPFVTIGKSALIVIGNHQYQSSA